MVRADDADRYGWRVGREGYLIGSHETAEDACNELAEHLEAGCWPRANEEDLVKLLKVCIRHDSRTED
jgi:hypothetical protein